MLKTYIVISPKGTDFIVPVQQTRNDSFSLTIRGYYYAIPYLAIAIALIGVCVIATFTRGKQESIALPISLLVLALIPLTYASLKCRERHDIAIDVPQRLVSITRRRIIGLYSNHYGFECCSLLRCNIVLRSLIGVRIKHGLLLLTHDGRHAILLAAKSDCSTIDNYLTSLHSSIRDLVEARTISVSIAGSYSG